MEVDNLMWSITFNFISIFFPSLVVMIIKVENLGELCNIFISLSYQKELKHQHQGTLGFGPFG